MNITKAIFLILLNPTLLVAMEQATSSSQAPSQKKEVMSIGERQKNARGGSYTKGLQDTRTVDDREKVPASLNKPRPKPNPAGMQGERSKNPLTDPITHKAVNYAIQQNEYALASLLVRQIPGYNQHGQWNLKFTKKINGAKCKFDKQFNTEKTSCTNKKFAAALAQAHHNSPVCRKLDYDEAEGNS